FAVRAAAVCSLWRRPWGSAAPAADATVVGVGPVGQIQHQPTFRGQPQRKAWVYHPGPGSGDLEGRLLARGQRAFAIAVEGDDARALDGGLFSQGKSPVTTDMGGA